MQIKITSKKNLILVLFNLASIICNLSLTSIICIMLINMSNVKMKKNKSRIIKNVQTLLKLSILFLHFDVNDIENQS